MNVCKLFLINLLLPSRAIIKAIIGIKESLAMDSSTKRKYQAIKQEVCGQIPESSSGKTVIYWASGWLDAVLLDVANMITLRKSGFKIILICPYSPHLRKLYRKAGVNKIFSFESFSTSFDTRKANDALKTIGDPSIPLINLRYKKYHIGKHSLSSFFRITRRGHYLNLSQNEQKLLKKCILLSSIACEASQKIIKNFRPDLIVGSDRGYTPQAELFDASINSAIPFVTWNVAHKNNTLILKRYNKKNSIEHPYSLSEKSWKEILNLPLGICKMAVDEIELCYKNQSWFKEVGTQFNTQYYDAKAIKAKLGIKSGKKIACVFPHIFWDATFFWGDDIFLNYQDWFENVCRCAKANSNVEWIIKIHPSNKLKNNRDGYHGEYQEYEVLTKMFGEKLPSHVHVLLPDDNISTISLIQVIDYCLTVRGTIGIECASYGKQVLTCGTGRYDQKGFTVDFKSRSSYIRALMNLDSISKMSAKEQELAQRFLYGTLIYRVYKSPYISFDYLKDDKATLVSKFKAYENEKISDLAINFFNSKSDDFTNKL